MTLDLERGLKQAWADHTDDTAGVARRLPELVAATTPACAQLGPLAALIVHVCGEHLGDAAQGLALLAALPRADDPAAAAAVQRHTAVLEAWAGDEAALHALRDDARIAALAQLAGVHTGRGSLDQAAAALTQALALADAGVPDASPALRALAVAGNNLAAAFEERASRSARENEAMLLAAETGLRFWRRAGTWLEEERAAYRLAHSRLAAGDLRGAQDSAQQCLAICEVNRAPPFERFFAQATLALVARAQGNEAAFQARREQAGCERDRLGADERPWCEADWLRLQQAAAAGR